MNSKILAISFVILTFACICQSQISFSTDWSGGKRSALSSEFLRPNSMEKRKPGWGKRSESILKRMNFFK